MKKPRLLLAWFFLLFFVALSANILAGVSTIRTIDLMRSKTEFAERVQAHNVRILP